MSQVLVLVLVSQVNVLVLVGQVLLLVHSMLTSVNHTINILATTATDSC